MAAARRASTGHRNPLLAKVHIAAKELGLKDDVYRDVLYRITGQRTAAGLTDDDLVRVLNEFQAKGWNPTVVQGGRTGTAPIRRARPADHPVARKARALWISLHQLGVVENRSDAALEAFAHRQLGVAKLQWADQAHAEPLIRALKAMAERAGWSQKGSLDQIKARLQQLLEARRV